MKQRFTLKELKAMPTISNGDSDDLKLDQDGVRVWLSRLDTSDGMPYNNQVTVEKNNGNGRMITIDEYEAK